MGLTVADLLVRFAADTRDADAGFAHMDQSINGFQQKNNGMLSSLASVGSIAAGAAVTGIVALGGAMTATAVSGTQMAMDLESQISGITSVLGESADSVAPLKQAILDLGLNPNLKVSTLEAADAMEALATQGLTMTEIIGGAAEATVLLSNATGGDFAQSANIMADAMNLFGESAGSYQDAVNGVVAVSNVSKFTVNDYALALAQAGGVASSVGVEFNDFNTSIAAISSLFGSGSDAGTSYKTMLSRLIPASDNAASAMQNLGLITADGSNQFFDAQGNLKSMADISGLLQGALSGLSEEQKNQALATIFGSDAMRAAVGLAKVGKEGFEELQATMGNTDALDAAAMRMDNAKGAMEILGGVIETVKIQIGDAFLPVIRQLATQLANFVTSNSGRITSFFQLFASVVGVAAASILPFIDSLFSVIDAVAGVVQVISEYIQTGELLSAAEFGMSEQTAALVDSFTGFAASVVDTVAAIMSFISPIVSVITSFVSWQDVLIALGAAIAVAVVPAIAGFVVAMAPIVATIAAVIGAVALLRNAWESDFLGIQTITTTVIGGIVGIVQPVTAAISGLVETFQWYYDAVQDAGFGSIESQESIGLFPSVLQPLIGWLDNTIAAFSSYRDTVIDVMAAILAFIQPTIDRIGVAFTGMVNQFLSMGDSFAGLGGAIGNVVSAILPILAQLAAAIGVAVGVVGVVALNLLAATFENLGTIVQAVVEGLTGILNGLAEIIRGAVALVVAIINGDWAAAWASAGQIVGGLQLVVESALNAILAIAGSLLLTLKDTVVGTFQTMGIETGTALQALSTGWALTWSGAQSSFDSAWALISGNFALLKSWLDTNLPTALNFLAAAWDIGWLAIKLSFDVFWGEMLALWTELQTWLNATLPDALTFLGDSWDTAWQLIKSNMQTTWSSLQSIWTTIQSWLTTFLPTALTALKTDFANQWESIKATTLAKLGVILGTFETMKTWLESTLQSALTTFKNFLATLGLPNPFAGISSAISGISGSLDGAKSAIGSWVAWFSSISIPNPFAGITSAISGITGGGGESGDAGGGSSSGGGSKSGSRGTIGIREQGNGVNVATLAAAIAEAMQSQPLVVNLAFNATITGEADAQQVSYQMARRISDIIQRRAT